MREIMGQHIRVLAINGAGNRALIQAIILHQLSMKSNKQVPELFDFIIGTGTGGILAAAYALPRTPFSTRRDQVQFTTRNILNLLENKLGYIFPSGQSKSDIDLLFEAKYSRNNLDSFLETTYKVHGVDLTLSHTLVPIVTTAHNAVANSSHFWCSCSKRYSKYFLKDTVGATTTLPTYFPHKFIPVQNATLADAKDCEFWLIKGSTGKCQHKQIYGGLFANSPLFLATTVLNYVRVNSTQNKDLCSKYNIFTHDATNLTLQFSSLDSSNNPAKILLGQDLDLTVVTLGTGHFVGNEVPTLNSLSGLRSLALAAMTFSTISIATSMVTITNSLKAPPAEHCKFIFSAISNLITAIGALAFSSYAYFSFIPKAETATDGYIGLLKGEGTLHKITAVNEDQAIETSIELFGSIVINPMFPNITQIPIDASDLASLDTISKTTLGYIERNPAAFHNLTKCLMNTDKRIEECDYASLFFSDNFTDPSNPSIDSMKSKEPVVYHDHIEL
jgi:patatin-like phospholipase/acyl hydrolase